MIKETIFFCLIIWMGFLSKSYGQDKVMTFQEAEKMGKPYQHLDDIYKSALHSDTELAVFKTPEEQKSFQQAYIAFIHGLNSFLEAHDFQWEQPTRCFNRIYFDADGTVDYFLYNFPKGEIAEEKEKQFEQLANAFVDDYRFTLTANEKFAQCSPIKYK